MKGLRCPGRYPAISACLLIILATSASSPAEAQVFRGFSAAPEQGGRGPQFSQNAPPVLSGTPPSTVAVGAQYYFRPTAYDRDGDAISFQIANKPAWLSFDPASGTLAGSPPASAIGIHGEIYLTASDGKTRASLPVFSIQVTGQVGSFEAGNSAGGGSAYLSWTPPVENEDGSVLVDLSGYRIFYGRQPGSYTHVLAIDNPGISAYVVENLAPGTWYFTARAVTYRGLESRDSGIAVRQVQ